MLRRSHSTITRSGSRAAASLGLKESLMMTMVRSDSLGQLPPAPFPSWSGTHAPRRSGCGGPGRIVRIFTWALLLVGALWHAPVQAQNAQNAPAALLDMVNTLTANGVFQ